MSSEQEKEEADVILLCQTCYDAGKAVLGVGEDQSLNMVSLAIYQYDIANAKSEGRAEAFRACAEMLRERSAARPDVFIEIRHAADWCDAQAKAQESQK